MYWPPPVDVPALRRHLAARPAMLEKGIIHHLKALEQT
jgi:hypothetical protein